MEADRASTLLAAGALVALVLAVFYPAFDYPFVDYDDDVYVAENPRVMEGLSADGFRWAFTSLERGNWHPLAWLSHQLDVELFGSNAGAHHRTNVVLHALSAVALLLVGRRLLGGPAPAFVLAALFAVHPTRVESVAWIAERKDVLSGLLWWLTILAYLHYARSPRPGRYALVLAVFALGLTAKPMVVTLPLVLLLLDFWPLGRLGSAAPAPRGRLIGRPWLEKVPLLLLSALGSAMALAAQSNRGTLPDLTLLAVLERVANTLTSYALYLKKLLWPTDLAVLYPHPGMPPLSSVLPAAAVLAALTGLAVAQRPRRPYLLFGWLWFLGTLLPVIGLVQVGVQSMADRYLYLPAAGVFLAVVAAGSELARRGRAARLATVTLCGVALVTLGFLARQQLRHWRDSESLYRHTLAVTSFNPIIRLNLGQLVLERGELDEAESHFQVVADRLTPWPDVRLDVAAGFVHLGVAQMNGGDTESAERNLRKARALGAEWGEAAYNLGLVLLGRGQYEEAASLLREAVGKGVATADALNNLGLALMSTGRSAEAAARFQEALGRDPNHWHAGYNLARLLAAAGDREAALRVLAEATARAAQLGASTAPLDELRVAIGAPKP